MLSPPDKTLLFLQNIPPTSRNLLCLTQTHTPETAARIPKITTHHIRLRLASFLRLSLFSSRFCFLLFTSSNGSLPFSIFLRGDPLNPLGLRPFLWPYLWRRFLSGSGGRHIKRALLLYLNSKRFLVMNGVPYF
jgi:hypothetical protein